MEYSSDTNTSDKDKKMLDTFEKYSDTEESEEKKDSKKKKKRRSSESEKSESQQKAEAAESKEKEDKEEPDDKKSSALDQLFDHREVEDEEAEPALHENIEELSDEETVLVTKQLIEARDEALHQELAETEPDSAEEAEVLANALYIERLAEHIGEDGEVDEATLDALVEETAAELDVIAEAEAIVDEAAKYDVIAEAESILKTELNESASEEIVEPEPSYEEHELSADEPEDSDELSDASAPTAASSSAHGGGSTRPPVVIGGGAVPVMPSASESSSRPSEAPRPEAPTKESSNSLRYRRGADMLVGGVIGYLIGRRRGRIKTEERLMPVQKSLEKKVKDLDEKITIREEKIRKLTAEKVAREGEDAQQVIIEKVEARARAKQEAKEARINKLESKKAERQKLEPEEADKALQISRSETETSQPERMASVLLAGTEFIQQQPEAKRTPKEIVKTMPETELLAVAAKIEIGHQNAKQLYEQGRVSKEDLREIVEAQLQGGGKAERLLIERMRPATDENLEALRQTNQETDNHSHERRQGKAGGPTPAIWADTPAKPKPMDKQPVDISAASDAIIAAQAARDHKEPNHTVAWIVVGSTVVLLVAAFFLF